MSPATLRLLAPPLLALVAAYVFDMHRIGGAALLGVAAWLGLAWAGRRLPLQFFAFAMFAAVIFGFMAAVFASLVGGTVYDLLARPWADQFVGITIACTAVAFGALATAGGLWTMVRGSPPSGDDEGSSGVDDPGERR